MIRSLLTFLFLMLVAIGGKAQENSVASTKPRNVLLVSVHKDQRTYDQCLALAQGAKKRDFNALALEFNVGVDVVVPPGEYYNFLAACLASDIDLFMWGTVGVDVPAAEGRVVAGLSAYPGTEGYIAFLTNGHASKLDSQKEVSDFLQPIKARREADPRFNALQIGIALRSLPEDEGWVAMQEWNGGVNFISPLIELDFTKPAEDDPSVFSRVVKAVADWKAAHLERKLRDLPIMPIGVISEGSAAGERPQTDDFLALIQPGANLGLSEKEMLTKEQWENAGLPFVGAKLLAAKEINRKAQPLWREYRGGVAVVMVLLLFGLMFLKAPLHPSSFLALLVTLFAGWFYPWTYASLLLIAAYELSRKRKPKKAGPPQPET